MTEPPNTAATPSPEDGVKAPYEVGRGRPPKAHRFKPGQSGNPSGRRKGSRNLATKIKNFYSEKVPIRNGKGTRYISRLEALIMKQWERAVKGDERATRAAIANAVMVGAFDDPLTVPFPTLEELHLLSDQALDEFEQIMIARDKKLRGGS